MSGVYTRMLNISLSSLSLFEFFFCVFSSQYLISLGHLAIGQRLEFCSGRSSHDTAGQREQGLDQDTMSQPCHSFHYTELSQHYWRIKTLLKTEHQKVLCTGHKYIDIRQPIPNSIPLIVNKLYLILFLENCLLAFSPFDQINWINDGTILFNMNEVFFLVHVYAPLTRQWKMHLNMTIAIRDVYSPIKSSKFKVFCTIKQETLKIHFTNTSDRINVSTGAVVLSKIAS